MEVGNPISIVLAFLQELELVVALDINLGVGSGCGNGEPLSFRNRVAAVVLGLIRSCPFLDFTFVQEPQGLWRALRREEHPAFPEGFLQRLVHKRFNVRTDFF